MGASSNFTGVAFVKETEWGTDPGTTYADVNYTAETLSYNISSITSNSIRSDRQISDLILVGADTSGGWDFELQHSDEMDELMRGAMWDEEWFEVSSSANTIDLATDTIDVTVPGSTFIDIGDANVQLVVGQWFNIKTNITTNDGIYQVTEVNGTEYTVSPDFSIADTITTGTLGGSMSRNGAYKHSYYIERSHSDLDPTGQFFQFAGMVADTFTLSAAADAVLTGSIGFIGKNTTLTQATGGTGSNDAAATTPFLNAVSNVGTVYIDGTPLLTCLLQSLTVNIANNSRGLSSVGILGYCDVSGGSFQVTGDMAMYFNDETMYDLLIGQDSFSLSFDVTEDTGDNQYRGYVVTLPKVKISTDAINSGGMDQDVMEQVSFQALIDPVTSCTIQIDSLPAITDGS